MTAVLLLLAAYLAGSFPTSHLAGGLAGVDLRERGSGNPGATNVYRVLGWKMALPVVSIDAAKGFVPAWFFPLWDGSASPTLALAYGALAIAGHVWPVFTRFRGGKGVATSAGVLLALTPFALLVAVLVWAGLVALTRVASIASLAAAVCVPVVAFFTDAGAETIAFTGAVALFIWWTHRDNLARLRRGEELRVRRERTAYPGEGQDRAGDREG